MLFALICAAFVMLVLAAVSLPLLSGMAELPARGQYDRAVYRDQLREVERDVARGVIGPEEAGAARLEIQRRLLSVDAGDGSAAREMARTPWLAATTAVFVVVGAAVLYWRLGAPGLVDVPFADRPLAEAAPPPGEASTDPRADIRRAAGRLEQMLAADPGNAGAWVLYARTTSMLGDWRKAADAYKHGIDLGQKTTDVFSGYGEMQVMALDGIVSPAARDAFVSALSTDASNAVARYYLALADAQAGQWHKAIDGWTELAGGLPEDSLMREEIGRRIADAAKNGGFAPPPMPKGLAAQPPPPGPTPDQMDAAGAMSPEQRAAVIGAMVKKLAAHLAQTPNDLDGWLRLGRAYFVLGDGAKAVDAYDHAAALNPGDSGLKLRTVAALLSGLKPGDPLPPRAVTLLNEVAAVAPDAPEVLWYLGVVAARDGRIADARGNWTRLLPSLTPGGEDDKMVRAALETLKEP